MPPNQPPLIVLGPKIFLYLEVMFYYNITGRCLRAALFLGAAPPTTMRAIRAFIIFQAYPIPSGESNGAPQSVQQGETTIVLVLGRDFALIIFVHLTTIQQSQIRNESGTCGGRQFLVSFKSQILIKNLQKQLLSLILVFQRRNDVEQNHQHLKMTTSESFCFMLT